jgi:hypothetical protein
MVFYTMGNDSMKLFIFLEDWIHIKPLLNDVQYAISFGK